MEVICPMPGIRDKNLRAGDLCEGFGLELLRPFAFVAPIPRPEDVGVDAVATLTRREGRRLFAEDSFLVQVKSASVRKIRFKGKELDWLRALRLPFFFLSVDLAATSLELRSIIHAASHSNFRDRGSVTMYLDETKFDLKGDEMFVWLGPPILRWTPADAANGDFQQTAYEVLKEWIAFEMETIILRSIGRTQQVDWETNCKPKPSDGYTIMHHPSELQGVLERIRPYIQRLEILATSPDENFDDLRKGLLLVYQFMRRAGVDPDPKHILEVIAEHRAKAGEVRA
jgi:hypothetical protein